jgi:Bacterial Ig-like domain (group 2)
MTRRWRAAVLVAGVATVAALTAHFANSSSPSTVANTATATAPSRPSSTVPTPSRTLTATRVTPAAVTLSVGESQQFTAIGTYSDGSTADITHSVVWTATDPSVAKVDNGGRVTAAGVGVTELLAMTLPTCAMNVPPCNVMAPAFRVLIAVR